MIMERDTRSLVCLFGPSGSGKTRLLKTMEKVIGSENVLRAGVETLVWEMEAALRFEGMTKYRKKYLELENLLLDNFWVLEKKPATAAEICRLIRRRQEAGKLTVVASDLPEHHWAVRNSEVAQLLAAGQSVML